MDRASTARRRACYVTRERDPALVDAVRRCGFDVSVVTPTAAPIGPDAPALLLVDAGCAADAEAAAGLLDHYRTDGGQVLLFGTADEQSAWSAWVSSGDAIFLRRPVAADYLEALLRDIQGEIPTGRERPVEPVALDQFGLLLGSSTPMRELYRLLRKAAGTDASVCIHGESGTGKELAARSIHAFSARSDQPFCAINCGAIPSELVESELFGHERGSFSGAERRHEGLFERARRGTLLLDEITEMPEDTQVKLLRVLESGHFRRVGGETDLRWHARLVTATNRDPGEAVAAGRLREDLYYRLRQFELQMPPLRERSEDAIALAHCFIAEFTERSGRPVRLGGDAEAMLRRYPWPGNVRELRHVVHSACRLCRSVITPAHLPALQRGFREDGDGLGIVPGMTVAEAERRLILATLEAERGDRKRAAERLGISVRTLYNRLRVYRAAASAS
ncbi:MAG TPA: sigma-54 dependent transcriptional regulator [Pseudohaliea sp.]|nr:sigma-54 dependent transcriptional regulator [Pseudohaliea sp.]